MASESVIAATAHESTTQRRTRPQRAFFFGMAALLLAIVLVGFAPTLYLRVFVSSDVPPLPGHLHVHGAILTSWFVWLVVQASLIRAGQVGRHRQLGIVGVVLGLAVVVAGPLATLNLVPGVRAEGFDLNADISVLGVDGLGADISLAAFFSFVVWANFASIATFLVLLVSAIALRGRSEAHKRLMLVASISILGPALARISRWPILGGEQGPFIPLALLGLLAALVAYDLLTRRRVHPATLIGGGFVILMTVAGFAIGASEFGEAVVRGM